jgi:hypothetical protein
VAFLGHSPLGWFFEATHANVFRSSDLALEPRGPQFAFIHI